MGFYFPILLCHKYCLFITVIFHLAYTCPSYAASNFALFSVIFMFQIYLMESSFSYSDPFQTDVLLFRFLPTFQFSYSILHCFQWVHFSFIIFWLMPPPPPPSFFIQNCISLWVFAIFICLYSFACFWYPRLQWLSLLP
jgi:hypothetical protein